MAFTSGLNIDEKVKMTDRERHAPLVFILDEEYMERISYRAKVTVKRLMGVAFVSVLHAAAHYVLLAILTGWPNALASPAILFCALATFAFGGLSTLAALASAYTLSKKANEVNKMDNSKFNVCGVVFLALHRIQLPGPSGAKCCDIPDDLRRLLYLIDLYLQVGVHISITLFFSMVLSVVLFCALVFMSQSVEPWIPILVALIPTTTTLLVMMAPFLFDIISA